MKENVLTFYELYRKYEKKVHEIALYCEGENKLKDCEWGSIELVGDPESEECVTVSYFRRCREHVPSPEGFVGMKMTVSFPLSYLWKSDWKKLVDTNKKKYDKHEKEMIQSMEENEDYKIRLAARVRLSREKSGL